MNKKLIFLISFLSFGNAVVAMDSEYGDAFLGPYVPEYFPNNAPSAPQEQQPSAPLYPELNPVEEQPTFPLYPHLDPAPLNQENYPQEPRSNAQDEMSPEAADHLARNHLHPQNQAPTRALPTVGIMAGASIPIMWLTYHTTSYLTDDEKEWNEKAFLELRKYAPGEIDLYYALLEQEHLDHLKREGHSERELHAARLELEKSYKRLFGFLLPLSEFDHLEKRYKLLEPQLTLLMPSEKEVIRRLIQEKCWKELDSYLLQIKTIMLSRKPKAGAFQKIKHGLQTDVNRIRKWFI